MFEVQSCCYVSRLVLEHTVWCSRTFQFFVMFNMFKVQFWTKIWCTEVFEVRSCLQWSFSLLFQFPREAGNYILIPAGMRVKCGKILYHNFIPKQGDFGPWIGSKMWKSQIFFKKGKNFLKIWKMMPIFLFIAFLILNFFQIWRNLSKFFFKKGKN